MSIILSRSIGLAAVDDDGINADNPIIGWRNHVTTANIAADGENSSYPATNLANASTAQKWVGASAVEQYLTVTLPAGYPIDYVGIARHNFGTGGIAVSVEVKSEADDDYAEAVAEFMPADDGPLIMRFTEQEAGFLRVKLAAGAEIPQAAVLYVGKLMIMPRRVYVGHQPITYGRSDNIANGRSEAGNFLGRIVTGQKLETTLDVSNVPPAWFREHMGPFLSSGAGSAFFFAWRPSSYPRETAYAWLTGDVKSPNQRRNGFMQVSMPIAGTAS